MEIETDFDDMKELKFGFSANEHGIFLFKPELIRARHELVSAIAKCVGGDIIHEKDIQSSVWNAAMQASESEPSQWPKIAGACLKEIEEEARAARSVVCSNDLVSLNGVERVRIGPVQAVTGLAISAEMNSKSFGKRFIAYVGNGVAVLPGTEQVAVGVAGNCWKVETRTSRAHQRARAEWLIDVAISFLRLTCLSMAGSRTPDRGDVEPNPIMNSGRNEVIYFDEKNITLPGWELRPQYEVGADVKRLVESAPFREVLALVFDPSPGSLAERFQRCLGWQAKARQAWDRAERFLFFFTAVEALLAHSDSTQPVIDTVSRHVASLLNDDTSSRMKNAKLVKDLYVTRSKLVHHGSRAVTDREQRAVQEVVENVSLSVLSSVDLAMKYSVFQDRLREASFGEPFSRPRAGWLD